MELASGMDESQGWTLGEQSQNRLEELERFIVGEGSKKEKADRLELLASVHFLIDRKQVSGTSAKEIHTILHRFGKSFTEKEVQAAIRELAKYELLTQ